jgi:hypothetical protein
MSDALPCVLFVDDEERILRSLRMLFRGRAEILARRRGAKRSNSCAAIACTSSSATSACRA